MTFSLTWVFGVRDLLDQGLIEIPVDGGIAARAGLLPDMHGDPADRIIVGNRYGGPPVGDR